MPARALRLAPIGLALAACLTGSAAAQQPTSPVAFEPAAIEFFENEIRPILVARCYECHGPDSEQKGGLRLDSRAAALAGGESGPAVVPGDLDASLLVGAVRHGEIFQMPPQGKLPAEEIAKLEHWVRIGAPWPAGEEGAAAVAPRQAGAPISEADRQWWSLRPVADPPPPAVADAAWPQSPLDRFILAPLEAAGLHPAAAADRRTLIRRVTFDLTGLPPTPEEVAAFLADESPAALARVVDRLLASPAYGERWGRHWLDVARYADSNGMDENLAYAHAWRYRDWVVEALNADLPYDQFVVQQLAADLLPSTGDERADVARLAATGFLCLGPKMLAEDDPVKMEMDIIDEQVDAVGRAFLALTLGCARCHDHKFDPIPTRDYYSLAGIFKSTKTMENHSVVAVWHERPLATQEELAGFNAAKAGLERIRGELAARMAAGNDALLSEARARAGDYLAAAALLERQYQRLESRMPADLASAAPQGTLVVEAERFARGDADVAGDGYGAGIGVILTYGNRTCFTEYEIDVPAAGVYQIELRYAAADARPVRLLLDGQLVRGDAAAAVTGTWYPDSQTWEGAALAKLEAGSHVVRLERPGVFPHIDKLALVPRPDIIDEAGLAAGLTAEQIAAERGLNGAILNAWRRHLAAAKDNATSPLSLWHEFERGPTAAGAALDASQPAAALLLADPRPAISDDLLARYAELLAAADEAWRTLRASPEGAQASSLPDAGLEALRQLLYADDGPTALPENPEQYYPADLRAEVTVLRDDAEQQEAALPVLPRAMAVEERQPANLRVHIRGNHLTLGDEAPRQFLRVIAGEEQTPIGPDRSGRLELARWIAAPQNPLAARAIVNRVWRWHFGEGLVRSPDNFGNLGELPTHPELLDWLASRLIEDGWSLKALHRRIVLSATYQMSAAYDERAAAADPENRLHWRHERRRLEAEALRDAVLAVGGRLDRTMRGSLLRSKDREYVASTASVNTANYESHRRSIYLPVVRSALYELYQAFDFADPSTPNGDRDTTVVAPQALLLMNSPLVHEAAGDLADRLLAPADAGDAASSDAARLERAWLLCYSRPPTGDEQTRAAAFLDTYAAAATDDDPATGRRLAWEALGRALLGSSEFVVAE
jgi:hypothetical protein